MKSNVRIIFLILCLHDDFKCSLAFFFAFYSTILGIGEHTAKHKQPDFHWFFVVVLFWFISIGFILSNIWIDLSLNRFSIGLVLSNCKTLQGNRFRFFLYFCVRPYNAIRIVVVFCNYINNAFIYVYSIFNFNRL